MFSGILSVNMDAKGRFAIPTRFRDRLVSEGSAQIAITIDPNSRNLVIYPLAHWQEIQEKISRLPSLDPHAKRLQRLVLGHAFDDVELDGSGRILVPPLLREYAQLDKKLVLLGQPNKLEIWAEGMWSTHSDELISNQLDPADMSADVQAVPL